MASRATKQPWIVWARVALPGIAAVLFSFVFSTDIVSRLLRGAFIAVSIVNVALQAFRIGRGTVTAKV